MQNTNSERHHEDAEKEAFMKALLSRVQDTVSLNKVHMRVILPPLNQPAAMFCKLLDGNDLPTNFCKISEFSIYPKTAFSPHRVVLYLEVVKLELIHAA